VVLPATLAAHESAAFGDDVPAAFDEDGGPRDLVDTALSPG